MEQNLKSHENDSELKSKTHGIDSEKMSRSSPLKLKNERINGSDIVISRNEIENEKHLI